MEVATVALLALGGAVGAAALDATSRFHASSLSAGDDSEEEDSYVPDPRERSISPVELEDVDEPWTSFVPVAREDTTRESISPIERHTATRHEECSRDGQKLSQFPQSQPIACSCPCDAATSTSSDLTIGRYCDQDVRLTGSPDGMLAESHGNTPAQRLVDGRIPDISAPPFWRTPFTYTSRPLGFAAIDKNRPKFLAASSVQVDDRSREGSSESRIGFAVDGTGGSGAARNVARSAVSSGKSDNPVARFCRSVQGRADLLTRKETRVKCGTFWLFRALKRLSGPFQRGQDARTGVTVEFKTPRDCDQRRQRKEDTTQEVRAFAMRTLSPSCSRRFPRQKESHLISTTKFSCYNTGRDARARRETDQVTPGRPNLSRTTSEPSVGSNEASSHSTTTTGASYRGERSRSCVVGGSSTFKVHRNVRAVCPHNRFDGSTQSPMSTLAASADEPVMSGGRKRRILPSTYFVSSGMGSGGLDDRMSSPHPKRPRRIAESQIPDLGGNVSGFSAARENSSQIRSPSIQSEPMSRSLSIPKVESKHASQVRVDRGTLSRRLLDGLQGADEEITDKESGRKGVREGRQEEAQKLITTTPNTATGGFMLNHTKQIDKRTSLEGDTSSDNSQLQPDSAVLVQQDKGGVQLSYGGNSATMAPLTSLSETLSDGEREQQGEKDRKGVATEQEEPDPGEYKKHQGAMDVDCCDPIPFLISQHSDQSSDGGGGREAIKKRMSLLGRRVLPPWLEIPKGKHVDIQKDQGSTRESQQGSKGQRSETGYGVLKTLEDADNDAPVPEPSTGRSGRNSTLKPAETEETCSPPTHTPESRESQSGT